METRHRCPCPGSTSPVRDAEDVVRLLRSPERFDASSRKLKEAAFKSSEMMPSQVKDRFEECGNSWGASVQRCCITPEEELRERARRFAAQLQGQEACPLAYGTAKEIRAIRDERKPDQQLVMILDDGCPEDPGHAVVRLIDAVDKSYFTEVRRQLLELFRLVE